MRVVQDSSTVKECGNGPEEGITGRGGRLGGTTGHQSYKSEPVQTPPITQGTTQRSSTPRDHGRVEVTLDAQCVQQERVGTQGRGRRRGAANEPWTVTPLNRECRCDGRGAVAAKPGRILRASTVRTYPATKSRSFTKTIRRTSRVRRRRPTRIQ